MVERANSRKRLQQELKNEKHRLRKESAAVAKERAQRIEMHKLEQLMDKVQESDKRIQEMQSDKQKEMDLIRRIKRDSLLKQKDIRQTVKKRLQDKTISPIPEASEADAEDQCYEDDDFED